MSLANDFRGSESVSADRSEVVLELPSDLRFIEAAVGYLEARCRAYSFDGPRLDLNFRVGVTEALANAVIYGNDCDPAKTVRVQLVVSADAVEVTVLDQGRGFDPKSVPDPTTPGRLQKSGGRGIFLIRKLMDELEFNERGNGLRMVLERLGAASHPAA